MWRLLAAVLLLPICVLAAVCALAAVLLWRASRRNVRLRVDASPRGHCRRVLRQRRTPDPIALADVPTVTDRDAVIVWVTAEPARTQVHAGRIEGPVSRYGVAGPPTRHHLLRLDHLQPDAQYRVDLAAAGTNSGLTLRFQTLPDIGRVRFRFATLTDTHFKRDAWTWPDGRLYGRGREVHERLLNGMLRHEPAFIIHKGDCSEPPGARRLMRYGDAMARCPVPVHYIPGNHDYYRHPDFARDWELMTGSRETYRSFTHDVLHVVLLNTCWTGEQERGFFGARQLRWLRDDLARHAALRTIVVTHHPIFGDPEENRVCHDAADFCAVVREFPNVRAVLSGHVHRNLVRRSPALPNVPNIETASGIQYPIGYAVYELCERGLRQSFHVIDDFALSVESWRASWLRSVTNPSEPMGRADHRNFVLWWADSDRGIR